MAASSVSTQSRDVPSDADVPHKIFDRCDSPLSQASTAASTPMLSSTPQRSSLLGSLNSEFFRLESCQVAEEEDEDDYGSAEDASTGGSTGARTAEDEADDESGDGESVNACPVPPALMSELAQWAEKVSASAGPVPPTLMSELAQWAEKVAASAGPVPPTLKSELAQWAEKVAASAGPVLPTLKSELAQWSEKQVQMELDLETDDSDSDGVEDDEVMTVDESYCTEEVEDDPSHVVGVGIPQLQSKLGRWAQKVVQAGLWLELQTRRRSARDDRLAAVEERAEAACEGGAPLEVCSIDEAGVLRGDMPAPGKHCTAAVRLREIHLRRRRRQHTGEVRALLEAPTLCADASGKVSLYLYLGDPAAKRLRRAKLTRPHADGSAEVLTIDERGVVRGSPADFGDEHPAA